LFGNETEFHSNKAKSFASIPFLFFKNKEQKVNFLKALENNQIDLFVLFIYGFIV
jgi:hypothetical protein